MLPEVLRSCHFFSMKTICKDSRCVTVTQGDQHMVQGPTRHACYWRR
jgi:hypothetical protein